MKASNFASLTGQVIATYYRVFKVVQRQPTHSDSHVKALVEALRAHDLDVKNQSTHGSKVKCTTLQINDAILVQIRQVRSLNEQHLDHLKTALQTSSLLAGLLINFGSPRPQARRVYKAN